MNNFNQEYMSVGVHEQLQQMKIQYLASLYQAQNNAISKCHHTCKTKKLLTMSAQKRTKKMMKL
jgi:hypothetical protein